MNKRDYEKLTRHSEVSEKAIERYLASRARSLGLLCLKYSNPCASGYPDRLIVLPGGGVAWVELKSAGCRPRPLQALRIASLREMGHRVEVVDSREGADALLEEITAKTARP